MALKLHEIPLSTRVDKLSAHTLIQFDDSNVRVVEKSCVKRGKAGRIKIRLIGSDKISSPIIVDCSRPLADVAALLGESVPVRGFTLPQGEIAEVKVNEDKSMGLRLIGLALVILWLSLGALWIFGEGLTGTMWRTVVLLAVLAMPLLVLTPPFELLLFSCEKRSYIVNGKSYPLEEMELPDDIVLDSAEQVDAVKEEYGQLLGDVAYRVEYPALFDAGEPHTERLTLALFRWDSTHLHLEAAEQAELAAVVQDAFLTARRHAEKVGMKHLPEAVRDDAGRALRAIRLSRDARATRAERRSALNAAIDILDDLALYYLPSPEETRSALNGNGGHLQLPGRRDA